MKIFIINLATSADRRLAASAELDRYGLEHEFFDAWTGDKALAENLFEYDAKKFAVRTGSQASKGQMGCFASHLMLWKKCLELNEPILILEDDFHCNDNFLEALNLASNRIQNYGLIRFFSCGAKGLAIEEVGNLSLRRFKKSPMTGLAYALSPTAAQKLIKNFDKFIEPLDFYIKRFWLTGQRDYQLYPEPIEHNHHSETTTIDYDTRAPKNLALRLSRLADQIRNSAGRKLCNLLFALHNALRPSNKI
jgi:glycosyl transferase family 25